MTTVAEFEQAFRGLRAGQVLDLNGQEFQGPVSLTGARGGTVKNFKVSGSWYPLYVFDALDVLFEDFEVSDGLNENISLGAAPGRVAGYGPVTGRFTRFVSRDAGQAGMSIKSDCDVEVDHFVIDGTGGRLTGSASWGEGIYVGYNGPGEWNGSHAYWGKHDVTVGPRVDIHHGEFRRIEKGEAVDFKPYSSGVLHHSTVVSNRLYHSGSVTVSLDYRKPNFGPWEVHDMVFESVTMHPDSPYSTPAAVVVGGTAKVGKLSYPSGTPGYGLVVRDLTDDETVLLYEAGEYQVWGGGTVVQSPVDPWPEPSQPEPEPEPEPDPDPDLGFSGMLVFVDGRLEDVI